MKQGKNKQKKSKKPTNEIARILQDKENNKKLDWHNFNFLENLLIFCTLPERIAPQESGVAFRITVDCQDKCLCILFGIDRRDDPLIREQALKRPDYMSLYINENLCICTIIEMKGTNRNSNDNGIEQILTFRDYLKNEIDKHLTTKLKIKYQGILLTPYNASVPLERIKKEASNGFIILPIQYDKKAELYNYISRLNKFTDKYKHQEITQSAPLFIEELLTKKALPKRINAVPYTKSSNNAEKEGICIDYLLSDDGDYLTLFSNRDSILIDIKGNELNKEPYQKKIEEELNILNLIQRLRIEFK
ncbi:MAG TPA: hypothetical protein VK203_20440 [Nostocaceae cyanobacterium]|nr:hypothetical protein [Nostocaceae cyanobacterium]